MQESFRPRSAYLIIGHIFNTCIQKKFYSKKKSKFQNHKSISLIPLLFNFKKKQFHLVYPSFKWQCWNWRTPRCTTSKRRLWADVWYHADCVGAWVQCVWHLHLMTLPLLLVEVHTVSRYMCLNTLWLRCSKRLHIGLYCK